MKAPELSSGVINVTIRGIVPNNTRLQFLKEISKAITGHECLASS
jgi:hypothetical protein